MEFIPLRERVYRKNFAQSTPIIAKILAAVSKTLTLASLQINCGP